MVDSTPELFRGQLLMMASNVMHKHPQERIVFINAWNEWAEGMYLEPDTRWGHAYLDAVSSVLDEISRTSLELRRQCLICGSRTYAHQDSGARAGRPRLRHRYRESP